LRVVSGWRLLGGLRIGEAEPAFRRNLAVVRDAKADAGSKAVALCWLLHVMADMHQPLHAGHRMSGRFPTTDRAGTIAWVRRAPDQPPINLHVFWDRAADLPGSDTDAADVIARHAESAVPPESLASSQAAPERQFHTWTQESEDLAATIAYRGDGLTAAARREGAPVVSVGYGEAARRLSERRLGEAGVRTARLMAVLFPAR
jgi:hypothetical protein